MPEQRKRLHCVAEITLSTTFLLASEVPAIAAFARSGLLKKGNSKTNASGYPNQCLSNLIIAEAEPNFALVFRSLVPATQ